MRFIYYNGSVFREDWPVTQTLPDGVRKKQIMIADLKQIVLRMAIVQEIQIPTTCPTTSAHSRDLKEFLIIFSDFSGYVHVNLVSEAGQFPDSIWPLRDLLSRHSSWLSQT